MAIKNTESEFEELRKQYKEEFGEEPIILMMQSYDEWSSMVKKALKTGKPIDYDKVRPNDGFHIY